jgi:hypothetical protein
MVHQFFIFFKTKKYIKTGGVSTRGENFERNNITSDETQAANQKMSSSSFSNVIITKINDLKKDEKASATSNESYNDRFHIFKLFI